MKTNKSIKFAEWLAQNHYRLYNVGEDGCEWVNEKGRGLTYQLYKKFKKEINHEKNN